MAEVRKSGKKLGKVEDTVMQVLLEGEDLATGGMAGNLGGKLGAIKTITDGSGFGGIMPMYATDAASKMESSPSSLTLQPGENELTYTVSVTYYLR